MNATDCKNSTLMSKKVTLHHRAKTTSNIQPKCQDTQYKKSIINKLERVQKGMSGMQYLQMNWQLDLIRSYKIDYIKVSN